jgi:hypothetical protein
VLDPVSTQIGENLGRGLETLEWIATAGVVVVAALGWAALYSGREGSARRSLGLCTVLAVHLSPILYMLVNARPRRGWGLAEHWKAWGSPAAFGVSGLVALLIWGLPWLMPAGSRALRFARGAGAALGVALVAGLVYAHRPPSLSEPLVEIASTRNRHSACGRTAGGAVLCLGSNSDGMLGPTEDHEEVLRPRELEALSPSSRIFLGEHATCGLQPPSTVRCVGRWRGESDRQWEARSSAAVEDLRIGDDALVFISPGGDLEVWSDSRGVAIATATSQQVLCGSALLFRRGEGDALAVAARTGEPIARAAAGKLGCYRDGDRCAVARLEGAHLRLRVDDTDYEVETPEDARFVEGAPWGVTLQAASRPATHAVCRIESGGFWSPSYLQCEWRSGEAPPAILRGDAASFAEDTPSTAAGVLAALTQGLQRSR